MRTARRLALAMLLLSLAGTGAAQRVREPIVGLPCEGCEAVFEGMPARVPTRARIAPASEPGEPMLAGLAPR